MPASHYDSDAEMLLIHLRKHWGADTMFLLEDGRIVAIQAKPEPLLEVRGVDGHHLIRLAWHLGNRLLVINKTDLAPHVGANLDVMEVDTQRVRGDRPYVFADTLRRKGLDKVIEFLEAAGGLSQH